LYWLYYF